MKEKKIKIIIVILAILLAVSSAGLAATILYNRFAQKEPVSVEVPGNIITPEGENSSDTKSDPLPSQTQGGETSNAPSESTDRSDNPSAAEAVSGSTDAVTPGTASVSGTKASAVVLHNRKPDDNTSFKVINMFPGDRETKYYCVKVSYKGDIVVRYHADIREGYEKLAEVLKVKIRLPETDETLYDGLMRDMPESLNHALYTNTKTQSELYYEITAYLDTSVGNEYQDKDLIADFRWWVEETDNLDYPQTGDTFNIYLWACLAAGSFFILLILLGKHRKESSDER